MPMPPLELSDRQFAVHLETNRPVNMARLAEFLGAVAVEAQRALGPEAEIELTSLRTGSVTAVISAYGSVIAAFGGVGSFVVALAAYIETRRDRRVGKRGAELALDDGVVAFEFGANGIERITVPAGNIAALEALLASRAALVDRRLHAEPGKFTLSGSDATMTGAVGGFGMGPLGGGPIAGPAAHAADSNPASQDWPFKELPPEGGPFIVRGQVNAGWLVEPYNRRHEIVTTESSVPPAGADLVFTVRTLGKSRNFPVTIVDWRYPDRHRPGEAIEELAGEVRFEDGKLIFDARAGPKYEVVSTPSTIGEIGLGAMFLRAWVDNPEGTRLLPISARKL